MAKVLLSAITSLFLGGCLASSPQIHSQESYRGPLIAAIAPIGGQVDQVTGWVLRHKVEQGLAEQIRAAAIFSAVEEIPSASAPNEAEIIIEPSFLQQAGLTRSHKDKSELAVHLNVRRKTTGVVALDQDYRVPCPSCALGRVDPQAMQALTKAINTDLKREFGRRPAG
ncbi:hypothetical protein Thiowin_02850 [Thiorhodovibrio winogradskyi]|uniref:Lipoprotein n=1 Tax=Thiorhodovibrio winogradskyi TaxID=77007 RepID=A0ABZ0SAY0_9GAMM|nr:hypothetical protein [Thiorhodovibrio winogradskyi]